MRGTASNGRSYRDQFCIWSRFPAPRFEINRFGLLGKLVPFLYFDSDPSNQAQAITFASIPERIPPNISGVPKGPPKVPKGPPLKLIASSTELESNQRSPRPIQKWDSFRQCWQRWLSALISNDLNRNREAGPHMKVRYPPVSLPMMHLFSDEWNNRSQD